MRVADDDAVELVQRHAPAEHIDDENARRDENDAALSVEARSPGDRDRCVDHQGQRLHAFHPELLYDGRLVLRAYVDHKDEPPGHGVLLKEQPLSDAHAEPVSHDN